MPSIPVADHNIQQVVDSNRVVLVDFWANWCGPCKAMAPALEAIADEYSCKAQVAKMDVDENPTTPSQLGVMSLPTLVVFKGGQPQESIVGSKTKAEIAAVLDKYI